MYRTDLRTKHVTVPGLRPGDWLEYRAVWRIVTPLAAVGRRPVPEARENLTRLAGKDKVEALLTRAREEIQDFHRVKLGSMLKDEPERLEAEFLLIYAPAASREAQVTGVKFIRGAEKLRSAAAALQTARYRLTFPDETATKLIRRGTLSCQPRNGECTFTMLPPEEVISVE